ncbi:1-deoxy-D-xylulose-5-phosphate reductoisomerase [Abyssisolibacter fermentans]|uniref:1-deoxy-D-xylulose-5-phosphate reductoisomerase n=1 Tax=Abyssisolibacter fermentans TaxID=1766203 RepID=UPI00082AAA11|nr:1-deoxy-D-xylulose-5-phosphate reductoisomerase [Abyssisolibacter fermentans]
MKKKISILGSTGSIGTQALDVIRNSKDFEVTALTANSNIDLLEKQIMEFKPKLVAVADNKKALELKKRMNLYDVEILAGMEGLLAAAREEECEIVISSIVGMVGLKPTLEAIKHKKTIALANKETLVTAGKLVIEEAKKNKVNIIPLDSEHSAIFQSLLSGKQNELNRIILTASGGPFRGKNKDQLNNVTFRDALKHPNWSMGRKISIDSATLMNKGLEVIEAKWLFDVDIENIDVVVHPQSIIHSMVEFVDGSIIAQLGPTDMRIPIQYALTYPQRKQNNVKKLDFSQIKALTFEQPDMDTFPCLKLAINALKAGGTMTAVLNAANEEIVKLFLNEKIKFNDIPMYIQRVMQYHNNIINPTLEDILQSDKWAREYIIAQF